MAERRRGRALEDALLDAAWQQLTENGYAAFTMDAVAARAGTSRPVLYRRWAGRHELLHATLAHVKERTHLDLPDTGTLRGDVLAVMKQANGTRTGLTAVMTVHLAEYYEETGTSPAELREVLLAGRRTLLDALYARAAERGEIDPDRLTERLRYLPFTLQRHEILMTLKPVPDATLEEIVDTIYLPLVRPRPPDR